MIYRKEKKGTTVLRWQTTGPQMISCIIKFNKILTSVLSYKFRLEVLGNILDNISHNDNGRTSPLNTKNFNKLRTLMSCQLSKAARIVLISEGTTISLSIE